MKKLIRFLLAIILIIVGLVCILGIIKPNEVTVTRSIMIKAPKDAVFAQMVNFKNWPNWSPWYEMEPTMKITYTGTDGQPGSAYSWVGDKTGEGEMKALSVDGTKFECQLDFVKPWKTTAHIVLKATDSAGMTNATWSFSTHMGFPFNGLQALPFMNMERMLGGDFEHGLANMKTYVEAHSAAVPATVEITEVSFPAHTYEGMRQVTGMADMMKFFSDTYPVLGKELGAKINGPATGLFYSWDTVKHASDMAVVFPVSDTSVRVKGATFLHVDSARAYMAVQKGGYSSSMAIHTALGKHVAENGKTYSLVVEEYLVSGPKEPDTSKWVTNIYYLIK